MRFPAPRDERSFRTGNAASLCIVDSARDRGQHSRDVTGDHQRIRSFVVRAASADATPQRTRYRVYDGDSR